VSTITSHAWAATNSWSSRRDSRQKRPRAKRNKCGTWRSKRERTFATRTFSRDVGKGRVSQTGDVLVANVFPACFARSRICSALRAAGFWRESRRDDTEFVAAHACDESYSRLVSFRECANSRSTRFPSRCPKRSLICLKPSMSQPSRSAFCCDVCSAAISRRGAGTASAHWEGR